MISPEEANARKFYALSEEIIDQRRRNQRLEQEITDLQRRLKITREFVPVESYKSLELALGEGGGW